MNDVPQPTPGDVIVRAVIGLLESGGYDAVQLREVARRAHVSLATIYKLFPTRDELIVTAIAQWMAQNCYGELALPAPDETLHDGLMRIFRYVFEPWERNPRMLEAHHRARAAPGGHRLDLLGMDAVEPVARAVLAGGDPDYVRDIELILTNMVYAVIGKFAEGKLGSTAILPALERDVHRITTNNEPAAALARTRRAGGEPAARSSVPARRASR